VNNIDISSNLLHIHTVKSETVTQINETKISESEGEGSLLTEAKRCIVSVTSTPSTLKVLVKSLCVALLLIGDGEVKNIYIYKYIYTYKHIYKYIYIHIYIALLLIGKGEVIYIYIYIYIYLCIGGGGGGYFSLGKA
jgi:hypothetical protein